MTITPQTIHVRPLQHEVPQLPIIIPITLFPHPPYMIRLTNLVEDALTGFERTDGACIGGFPITVAVRIRMQVLVLTRSIRLRTRSGIRRGAFAEESRIAGGSRFFLFVTVFIALLLLFTALLLLFLSVLLFETSGRPRSASSRCFPTTSSESWKMEG